jgi:hypothetical protein
MTYVEFPMDVIREVRWKKKDGGGGGGPGEPGDRGNPCGAYSAPSQGTPAGIWQLQDTGLYQILPSQQSSGGPTLVILVPAQHIQGGTFTNQQDYLWEGVSGFTVSASNSLGVPVEIKVWRNLDPQSFNPCSIGASQSGNPVAVDNIKTPEIFPPIIMPILAGSQCEFVPCYLTVQSHCMFETDGGLPPQPAGYPQPIKIITLGPALAGSVFFNWFT